MSQKAGKRSRRHTDEEVEAGFKVPGTSKGKEDNIRTSKDEPEIVEESNGFKNDDKEAANVENGQDEESPSRVIQTRSRSSTPLKKQSENTKGGEVDGDDGEQMKIVENEPTKDMDAEESKSGETNGTKDDAKHETNEMQHEDENTKVEIASPDSSVPEEKIVENGSEQEEYSPITLSISASPEPPILEKDEEEAIPELEFDENDLDVESEGSPNRCKTRRSQTRHVSTPKTPKLIIEHEIENKPSFVSLDRLPEDNASGKSTPRKPTSSTASTIGSESQPDEIVDLDTSDTYSSISIDNVSTRAVAGSDATRNADFTYQDSGLFDENSIITSPVTSPQRTLGETLRNLSPRRAIHPTVNDYRKIALQNSLDIKGDVYMSYESVQKVSAGMKRKNRSVTPEGSKRYKKDTPGLLSYISAPISNFKSTFSSSTTPKLVKYECKSEALGNDDDKVIFDVHSEADKEKKWCSIM